MNKCTSPNCVRVALAHSTRCRTHALSEEVIAAGFTPAQIESAQRLQSMLTLTQRANDTIGAIGKTSLDSATRFELLSQNFLRGTRKCAPRQELNGILVELLAVAHVLVNK